MAAKSGVLNLDAVLGKARQRIYRIGIELEGGWKCLPDGVQPLHDGSVNVQDDGHPASLAAQQRYQAEVDRINRRIRNGDISNNAGARLLREAQQAIIGVALQVGEIPSDPMEPEKVESWMAKYYPSHVNATCGLHVHKSFKSALHYQRLMTPAYQDTVVAYLLKWAKEENLPKDHPIFPRLAGKSDYCQLKYYADQQAQTRAKNYDRQRPGHRYTAINYCWSTHGTVECRLLPMLETADQGIRAVKRVLDITNAFLAASGDKEVKVAHAEVVSDERTVNRAKYQV